MTDDMDTIDPSVKNDSEFPFINIKSDYGFKWMFGSPERKSVLIRFLNAIFKRAGLDIIVEDVAYHDKEILPPEPDGKRIVYDIFCSSPKGERFIVEMQNVYEPMFSNRVIFYTSKAISEQGEKGWDYMLKPVFSIVVSNFNIPRTPKSLFHNVVLFDKETSTIYSDKMNIIFICLPEVPKEWNNCKTEFERLTYLVKNMELLTENSKEYKDMNYSDIFNAARKSGMSDGEFIAYSQSESKYKADQRALKWATDQSRAEGRAEGKIEKAVEIVRNMLNLKMDLNTIIRISGLDADTIRKIATEM